MIKGICIALLIIVAVAAYVEGFADGERYTASVVCAERKALRGHLDQGRLVCED